MDDLRGHYLIPGPGNTDPGLWFIFHHESEGILAFDLTKEHPDIPFRHFHAAFKDFAHRPSKERVVLIGGPMQSDSAMIVLHNDKNAGPGTHVINDHFSFHSFRYVLKPGKPPAITDADFHNATLSLDVDTPALVVIGFRLWDMETLEDDLKNWRWNIIPASPQIVFHTSPGQRFSRARARIN